MNPYLEVDDYADGSADSVIDEAYVGSYTLVEGNDGFFEELKAEIRKNDAGRRIQPVYDDSDSDSIIQPEAENATANQ